MKRSLKISRTHILGFFAATAVIFGFNTFYSTVSEAFDDSTTPAPAGSPAVANTTAVSSPAVSSPSIAAPLAQCAPFAMNVNSVNTNNSTIQISATVPDGTHWIMVGVQRASDSTTVQKSAIAATAGAFSKELYITSGAGDYSVVLYSTPNDATAGTRFESFCIVNVHNTDTRDLNYLEPSADVESDNQEIITLSQSIIAAAGANTDREKSTAIHDWVANHIAYDTVDFFAGTYPASDAVGTLHRGSALCEGYASLNAALHRAAGIRAEVVVGNAQQYVPQDKLSCDPNAGAGDGPVHAWNLVLIEGQWLIQDTTWDSGGVNFAAKSFAFAPTSTYLFPDPAKFAKDHLQCSVSPI